MHMMTLHALKTREEPTRSSFVQVRFVAILCIVQVRTLLLFIGCIHYSRKGYLTVGNVMEILPFQDPIVVLQMDGRTIWAALESSLSAWPAQEG